MNFMYLWYALDIGIRTDAMNAISDIDYQFSTYTTYAFYSNDVKSTILQNCLQSMI